MTDADGPAHVTPTEDCAQLTTRFLGIYTQCDGLVEDIGYVYLSSAPDEILTALLPSRGWSAQTLEKLLKAVLGREPLDDAPALFKKIGPGRTYPLVAEWRWATEVRNDLAHSTGSEDPGGGWRLKTRSSRYYLKRLPETVNPQELWGHTERLYELQGALIELGSCLGLRDLGWEGSGPIPV